MPFLGNGVFNVVYNFVNDAANGIKILASRQDTQWADIATNGLSNVICKDGQSTTTQPIPFAQGISFVGGTTFNVYVEGNWTPTDGSGTGLVFTVIGARYTKIGRAVLIECNLQYPVTANGSTATIAGLPFTINSVTNGTAAIITGAGLVVFARLLHGTNSVGLIKAVDGSDVINSTLSGQVVQFSGFYSV